METVTSPSPLLPAHRAEDSVEALLAERAVPSRGVYLLILALTVCAGAALPWIQVPVWVESGGILRPALEKHEVRAGASGMVEEVRARENERVRPGEVLLTVRDRTLDARGGLLDRRLAEHQERIRDLEVLLASDSLPALGPGHLRTAPLRIELLHLQAATEEQRQRTEQAAREEARARLLLARQLIPAAELETAAALHRRERLAEDLLRRRALREWAERLTAHRGERLELEAERSALTERSALRTVVAPVAGTVEQLAGVSRGSLVREGERIATISPDARLIAEVLVSSRDIGLLAAGTPVRMRLDAFRSSDWGTLPGRISEIPGDALLVDGSPAYRVRVALSAHVLALPDGTLGELRKGMTLRARFLLARRTLWQLLRDDASDWFGDARRGDASL